MTAGAGKQRLDKWLFFARILKSRTLAQKLIETGAVRVNGQRVDGADTRVGPGDTLTLTVHERLRVLEIRDPGTRRGPASEAQTLYADHSPPLARLRDPDMPPGPHAPYRPKGAGRPTKRERRQIERLRDTES